MESHKRLGPVVLRESPAWVVVEVLFGRPLCRWDRESRLGDPVQGAKDWADRYGRDCMVSKSPASDVIYIRWGGKASRLNCTPNAFAALHFLTPSRGESSMSRPISDGSEQGCTHSRAHVSLILPQGAWKLQLEEVIEQSGLEEIELGHGAFTISPEIRHRLISSTH